MAMKTIKLFLVSLFFVGNASAVIPENGWWWNAAESGRGFNLEIQNDLLFFASFAYDLNGNPVWLTAGGQMTGERDWSATLYVTAHGQCFGCPYTPPQLIPAGVVSLHFNSSQAAVLTVNGYSVNVSRFDFWLNNTAPDAMMGQWSAVIGTSFDIFDGERIDYSIRRTDSSGTYLGGNRLGSTLALNPAVVSYNFSTGSWSALLDSSTSFYRLFIFNTTGFNRVEGSFYIYQKGANPTGGGTFYQAFRTASAARIQTGIGPGSSKRALDADQLERLEQRDALLYQQLNQGQAVEKSATPPELIEIARALEERLAAQRSAQP
jgi:hypothetical protein